MVERPNNYVFSDKMTLTTPGETALCYAIYLLFAHSSLLVIRKHRTIFHEGGNFSGDIFHGENFS